MRLLLLVTLLQYKRNANQNCCRYLNKCSGNYEISLTYSILWTRIIPTLRVGQIESLETSKGKLINIWQGMSVNLNGIFLELQIPIRANCAKLISDRFNDTMRVKWRLDRFTRAPYNSAKTNCQGKG